MNKNRDHSGNLPKSPSSSLSTTPPYLPSSYPTTIRPNPYTTPPFLPSSSPSSSSSLSTTPPYLPSSYPTTIRPNPYTTPPFLPSSSPSSSSSLSTTPPYLPSSYPTPIRHNPYITPHHSNYPSSSFLSSSLHLHPNPYTTPRPSSSFPPSSSPSSSSSSPSSSSSSPSSSSPSSSYPSSSSLPPDNLDILVSLPEVCNFCKKKISTNHSTKHNLLRHLKKCKVKKGYDEGKGVYIEHIQKLNKDVKEQRLKIIEKDKEIKELNERINIGPQNVQQNIASFSSPSSSSPSSSSPSSPSSSSPSSSSPSSSSPSSSSPSSSSLPPEHIDILVSLTDDQLKLGQWHRLSCDPKKVVCNFCRNEFSTKHALLRHFSKCKVKKGYDEGKGEYIEHIQTSSSPSSSPSSSSPSSSSLPPDYLDILVSLTDDQFKLGLWHRSIRDPKKNVCAFCKNEFATKHGFFRHLEKCKVKKGYNEGKGECIEHIKKLNKDVEKQRLEIIEKDKKIEELNERINIGPQNVQQNIASSSSLLAAGCSIHSSGRMAKKRGRPRLTEKTRGRPRLTVRKPGRPQKKQGRPRLTVRKPGRPQKKQRVSLQACTCYSSTNLH